MKEQVWTESSRFPSMKTYGRGVKTSATEPLSDQSKDSSREVVSKLIWKGHIFYDSNYIISWKRKKKPMKTENYQWLPRIRE